MVESAPKPLPSLWKPHSRNSLGCDLWATITYKRAHTDTATRHNHIRAVTEVVMEDTAAPDTASTKQNPARPRGNEVDNSIYTWGTFFTLLTGGGTPEDRRKYFRARDMANEAADCKRCEKQRDWLLNYSKSGQCVFSAFERSG